MFNDPIPGLRSLLRKKLTGSTEAPSMSTREYWLIDSLCEIVEDYGQGVYSRDEVREHFRDAQIPGFDIDLWIQSKEDEGVYSKGDWTEDEPEELNDTETSDKSAEDQESSIHSGTETKRDSIARMSIYPQLVVAASMPDNLSETPPKIKLGAVREKNVQVFWMIADGGQLKVEVCDQHGTVLDEITFTLEFFLESLKDDIREGDTHALIDWNELSENFKEVSDNIREILLSS